MRPPSAACWKRPARTRWMLLPGPGWMRGCRAPAGPQDTRGDPGGRSRWTARRCGAPVMPAPAASRHACWLPSISAVVLCPARSGWTARPTRSPGSRRCPGRWTWPGASSPPTRCTPSASTPSSLSRKSRRTTSWSSSMLHTAPVVGHGVSKSPAWPCSAWIRSPLRRPRVR